MSQSSANVPSLANSACNCVLPGVMRVANKVLGQVLLHMLTLVLCMYNELYKQIVQVVDLHKLIL
jgi:hypothetical protein